jgi:hypothetical protein
MINNGLYFLFNFFNFLNFLYEWKIILINFWCSFFELNIRHLLMCRRVWLWRLLIINRCFILCLWLITDDTSFWPRRHKWSVRINLLLDLYLFDYDLLLDYWFWRDKIFKCMCVLYWENLCCYKWISMKDVFI